MTGSRLDSGELRRWLLIALFTTAVGLVNFTIIITNRLAGGFPVDYRGPLVDELTGAWSVLLLLPLLLPFIRRFPIARGNWRTAVPLHVGATVVFGLSHTLLMWGSRSFLYEILGWGGYDYGDLRFRFLMEYQKQFLGYWLIYAAVRFIERTRESRDREIRASELERQLSQARLAALKMQLNPHFLFNTLNMVSSHLHDDPDRADAMLARLGDFLRMTLREGHSETISLSREIEFVDAYTEIMSARFGEKLRVRRNVDPAALDLAVPPLLLQPIMENAMRHAIERSDRGGTITITVRREDATLSILVEDDGPGISEPKSRETTGIGLVNSRQRLTELYGDEAGLSIEPASPSGTRVTITMPARRTLS